MEKNILDKSKNSKFLEALINEIFFSKSFLNKATFNLTPFYSNLEKNLIFSLKKINDQRCLGYIKSHITSYDKDTVILKEHREQGNLKARLIKNYNFNDELIIINTAGGLTSGDLNVNLIIVSDNVNLNITTQSMEKIYFCKNISSYNYINIVVGSNSYVSWLPLETIFFNGGKLRRRINIELAAKSSFLGIETIIFGRKAMGEKVIKGNLDDAWQIYQNGTLVYSDFNRISGNISKKLSHKLVMRGNCILCNIVFVGKKIKTYKRKILNNIPDSKHMAGVSIVNGVLLLKVLAKDISDIRLFLEKLFYVFDKNFNVPKLWSS